jgi:O-antigen/teichoic acid export membrane protein
MQLQWVAATTALAQVAQFAMTAAIAVSGGSLILFTIPAVLCELVNLALTAPRAHRMLPIRYRVRLAEWRSLLREALPLSIGAAFTTLTYRVDSIMLSGLDGFVAVGRYNVAFKFADLLHFVATAVSTPMLTILVASYPDRPVAFRGALRRASSLLVVLAACAVVGFGLYAGDAIALLYGDAYAEAGLATTILVASQGIGFATTLAFVVLAATAHHRAYPWVAAGGLLANLALNAVLIPRWSYEGAAFATLLTEVLVLGALAWLLGRVPHVRPFPLGAVPGAAAAALGALGAGLLLDGRVPWFVGAVAVTVVFAALARLLGALDPAQLRDRR